MVIPSRYVLLYNNKRLLCRNITFFFVNLHPNAFECMKSIKDISAKPFIKWVGGKTQLLDEVKRSLPSDLEKRTGLTYVEPFVGGGAVLFWILQEYPNIERAVINDINAELICTYRVIKSNVEALIQELNRIQSEYISMGADDRKEYFLSKRALFNSRNISDIETAALFIFLNRTCFNGLYRVNSRVNSTFLMANTPTRRFVMKTPCVQTLPFFRRLKFFAAISAKPACLPDMIPCSTLILRINL